MAQVTLNSKDMIICLFSLMNRLGKAIAWVLKQPGKITVNVPDYDRSPGVRPPLCGSCFAPIKPPVRAETVLLTAIQEKMGEKAPTRPGRKARR